MTAVPQPVNNATMRLDGRDYCAFGLQNGISCVPVDQLEDTLFNNFHTVLTANEILQTVPSTFSTERGIRAIDCGYGTGIWCDEVLSYHLDNYVAGIDIFHRTDNDVQDSDTDDDSEDDSEDNSKNGSEGRCEESCEEDSDAVQELDKIRWNLNAHFRDAPSKHDLKPEEFDLINSRFLADGINKERWKPLVEEYKKLLRPGGWLQMAEAQWLFRSQSGQDLPALKEWSKKYYEGLSLMRKAPDIARQLERIVRWEGFERVSATTHDIHLEGWRPEEEHDDGSASVIRYVHGILSSFALVPFTQVPGWNLQRCRDVVQAAQAELRTRNKDIFFKLTVVYGQKKAGSSRSKPSS